MNNTDIFVRVLLTDKIKLKPRYLGKSIKYAISNLLRVKYEGKCSHHGYILPNSIVISKYSAGLVLDVSLNGDIIFNVLYFAEVCNPSIGSIIAAKIVNTNQFGILAESGINIKGIFTPILECIVPLKFSQDIDAKVNDVINIEILGKKYQLNDKQMSIVGKIVSAKSALKNDGEIAELDHPDDVDAEVDDAIDSEEEEEEKDEDDDEKEEEEDDDVELESDDDEEKEDDKEEEEFFDDEDIEDEDVDEGDDADGADDVDDV